MPSLNLLLPVVFLLSFLPAIARQPDHDKLTSFPARFIDNISKKASRLEKKLNEQAERALKKMYRNERRLKKELTISDPAKAKEIFSSIDSLYSNSDRLLKKRRSPQPYIPALDTLTGAVKFLEQNSMQSAGSNKVGDQLAKALGHLNGLDERFKKATHIKNFLKERRQYLKERLQGTPLVALMTRMNKDIYYYSQTINEYKDLLNDRKKLERKALSLLGKTTAFKKFMQQHSQLASLLNIPTDNTVPVSFTGLQTRASVQQVIANSVPNAGSSQQFIAQQLGAANQQASSQRNQLRIPQWEDNLGEMPDFKPNGQKTKSFLKRLEYGCDLQFGKVNRFLPASTELALTVGYKLNDNSTAGIGSSYKLGLGSGISNIRFSHQGFGLRSFIDWKLKGSIHLSGGYEKNYLPQLNSAIATSGVPPFAVSSWQESGLIGLSKKYTLGKNRKGSVQLLFDFLSFQNVPRSQPLIFRTGIKL